MWVEKNPPTRANPALFMRLSSEARRLRGPPVLVTPAPLTPSLFLSPPSHQEWALKWTNKLERRVVGFVITSGGTSIEQRGGGGEGEGAPVGSKGSGVAGKGVADLLAEATVNYRAGGLYA